MRVAAVQKPIRRAGQQDLHGPEVPTSYGVFCSDVGGVGHPGSRGEPKTPIQGDPDARLVCHLPACALARCAEAWCARTASTPRAVRKRREHDDAIAQDPHFALEHGIQVANSIDSGRGGCPYCSG